MADFETITDEEANGIAWVALRAGQESFASGRRQEWRLR